ncbi:MAG: amino acid permease [Gammaproteobacteria bacterium]|nr:MAG: amino acid permease [Gammaproteobacteria bacterium]RLA34571.1 MAG: amino acid permease [Gammaproteobacteria bacterium]
MATTPQSEAGGGSLVRTLGVMDLVFLNMAAILGLRWLSTAAQMGPASLVLWVLAVVTFFIPSALTVRELSSRLPGEGGIYLWSKAAFGEQHGFISGWAYWVNNLFYFPSLLLFIAGTFLFLGGNEWLGLGDSAVYNTAFSLTLLWLVIGTNVIGLKRGKWIQNVGALSSAAVFAILIVGGIWAWIQFGSETEFTVQSATPDLSNLATLTFFATMTFAFAGMELAPAMSGEIKNPVRAIPRAMVISGLIITTIYIMGTGLLMVAVPEDQIGVITGIPQAVAAIGERIALPGLAFVGVLLIVMSGTGGLGAWISGVARIPYVIGIDRYLPAALGKTHPKWGTPHVALITQGVVVTLLMIGSVTDASIEEAYIMLLDMTIILYFVPFLYMFAALPVLRRKAKGNDENVHLVPGGIAGVWLVASLGFVATFLSVILALMPPEGSANPQMFVVKVGGGCLLFIVAGLGFYYRNRR